MTTDVRQTLTPLFYPGSVALIGASKADNSHGRMRLADLLNAGFDRTKLYPVNLRGEDVLGIKGYSSVKEISGEVDLAIIAIPRQAVPQVIRECTEKGVKGVVIFASGFGESGNEGKRLQEDIVRLARAGVTRIIGPNCTGIYNPSAKLVNNPDLPGKTGPVAMISNSGYLTHTFALTIGAKGIGVSKVVSIGNQCDLNACDFLEYFGQDPETKIIAAYLEDVKEGRRFFQLARSISPRKPIILWKGGTTREGARAAASHTGALAGVSEVWQALFAQTGIISADSFEQLIDFLVAFHYLPRAKGRRVAIISSPGGFAVSASDACSQHGLKLARLSPGTRQQLQKVLPAVGTSTANPVDLGARAMFVPGLYRRVIEVVLGDQAVDLILISISNMEMKLDSVVTELKEMAPQIVANKDKAVVFAATSPDEADLPSYRWLAENGIPVYRDPRRAASALARLADYSQFVRYCEQE